MSDVRYHEKKAWARGFRRVAGADEVGRGAFAGPVVAGAVVFRPDLEIPEDILIDDSKKLRTRQRERAEKWIKQNTEWGVGEVSVSVINRLGMGKATQMAFRRAISACIKNYEERIQFLLIDAFYLPYTKGLRKKNQLAIVDGDEKSISIAAASIIAKVHRDKLMRCLSRKHPYYGWGSNKGYGTIKHRKSILRYGLTRYHRKQFVANLLTQAP